MKIYQLLQIGTHHTNHCEDYAIVESIGPNKWLCAVMDGCTMGTDSYLASTLVGKLLRKIAIQKSYHTFFDKTNLTTTTSDLKDVLCKLMVELKSLKSQLLLNEYELLTTLVLAILDLNKDKGEIIVLGDGLVCINGQFTEFEQDNKPDYLGYHLAEDFEEWFNNQNQILSIDRIEDISLCTDGIFTFSYHDKRAYKESKDPLNFLLLDRQDDNFDHMLSKKCLFLEQLCGLKPTDDQGIIRVINE